MPYCLPCPRHSILVALASKLLVQLPQGTVKQRLEAWPERDVKLVVLTDGQRILGLGRPGLQWHGHPCGYA